MKNNNKILYDRLKTLTTEQINPRTRKIDSMDIPRILRAINREDRRVPLAVGKEINYVARAVRHVVKSFKCGGRLIYVGAGTSGRLGILDAAECPPTYGTDPSMVQGIIAGGPKAVFRSQEGSEDRMEAGVRDIRLINVGNKDVVCGLAASLRTPYVMSAIKEAKRRGAKTIYVTTNPRSILRKKGYIGLRKYIDVAICVDVGPEVIMGSTRMKSGTAQKMVLNMISTAAMISIGKVYGNMMVDLKMNSQKLMERAKRVIMTVTGVDYDTAARKLVEAKGHVKTAIVMIKLNVSYQEARLGLERADGFVHRAVL